MIDDYLYAFEANLVGTGAEKDEWVRELGAHLQEAADAGDLSGALERLGSPREAAAVFRTGRPLVPADARRRALAQAIDFVPLIVLSVASLVVQLARHHHNIVGMFPPALAIGPNFPTMWNIGVPIALAWSWFGLGLIEGATGRTPGKALLGLRTVSDDGTALTRRQAVDRRWSIVLGPLAWVDWLGMKYTRRRQRLLDLLAHTMVIDDPVTTRTTRVHDHTPVSH